MYLLVGHSQPSTHGSRQIGDGTSVVKRVGIFRFKRGGQSLHSTEVRALKSLEELGLFNGSGKLISDSLKGMQIVFCERVGITLVDRYCAEDGSI
jgi:hypothetical protein